MLPEFDEVDVSKYVGNPGNTIRIRVTDDFMVKTVDVTINDQDGSLVEQGAATNSQMVWTGYILLRSKIVP
jgi:hypothetical protein